MICIWKEYDMDAVNGASKAIIQADTTPTEFPLTGANVKGSNGAYLGEAVIFGPGSIIHCLDTGKNWVMNEDMTAWCQDGSTNSQPAVYPHITLYQHELTMFLNGSESLNVQDAYPMDPYSLVWTTSDNDVVYLSETGTIEGVDYIQIEGRQVGTATVTVTMTYNGKTYSDSCLVTVTE